MRIGPLVACAIGDAYGAGFEFIPPDDVAKQNDLAGYKLHPRWGKSLGGIRPGEYTDDTQMSLAVCEHLLTNSRWNHSSLAQRWVGAFKRDPRRGYAAGFFQLLVDSDDGDDLLSIIEPTSYKNGGAMRAWPLGFLMNPRRVIDLAMLQASVTHATQSGMAAAAAAALMFHYCWYDTPTWADLLNLPFLIDSELPGFGFQDPWEGHVSTDAVDTVRAALTALVQGTDMASVLRQAVAWTGDVDTVAAIAMPAAAVCGHRDQDGMTPLFDGLENAQWGRDFLMGLDEKLALNFPRVF